MHDVHFITKYNQIHTAFIIIQTHAANIQKSRIHAIYLVSIVRMCDVLMYADQTNSPHTLRVRLIHDVYMMGFYV